MLTRRVDDRDLKGLRALMEDQKVCRAILVSQDPLARKLPGNVSSTRGENFAS